MGTFTRPLANTRIPPEPAGDTPADEAEALGEGKEEALEFTSFLRRSAFSFTGNAFVSGVSSASRLSRFRPPRLRQSIQWMANLSDREFRGRRENLTEFLRGRAPHNDAPSPHAGPFRAIRRLATQGDSLASTSQRVYRLDRGACTPVAADQILSRESTAKARQEYHPNRTRLISRRHVRRRYVRSHRARDLRGSSAITGIARPSLPPVRSTRGRRSLACRVAGTIPTALENTDDIRDRPTDAPFPASLDRQMRCPRSSWTWERTR